MEQWNNNNNKRNKPNKINDLQAKNPVPCQWNIWNIWNNLLEQSFLLTPVNKFACVINIIISFGNYHEKRANKKAPEGAWYHS